MKLILASTALFSLFLLGSCEGVIWGQPPQQVRQWLAEGRWDFLMDLSEEDLEPSQLGPLGPGASHYLGLVLMKLDRTSQGLGLLEYSAEHDSQPWSLESYRFLIRRSSSERNHTQTVRWGQLGLRRGLLDKETSRLFFEAHYWLREDEEAWNLMKTWKEGDYPLAQAQENLLFEMAVRGRMEDRGWQQPLLRLIEDVPAGPLHIRAESFLNEDNLRWGFLSPQEQKQLQFKAEIARSNWVQAERMLKDMSEPFFWYGSGLLADFELVHRQGKTWQEGARKLQSMVGSFPLGLQFNAFFHGARLLRFAEDWVGALQMFHQAYQLATNSVDQEKVLWNLLHVGFAQGLASGLDVMRSYSTQGLNLEYFDDHFETLIGQLVTDKRWGDLALVYLQLEPWVSGSVLAEYSLILARIHEHGLHDLRSPSGSLDPRMLLERAARRQPRGYFGLMSQALLGQKPRLWSETKPLNASLAPQNGWILQYLDYGLISEAFTVAFALNTEVDVNTIRAISQALQDRNELRSGIRLIARAWQRADFEPTLADWKILYPKGFENIIEGLARDEGFHPNLFFALVRQESTFDPKIKSYAGAVGLAQLMPETAQDVAKRLRMPEYDLTNPEDNLRLGARYLSMRLESLGNPAQALMAYNAGISRVRTWNRTLGNLPDEVYNAAVPFSETKDYVRRILAGVVFYSIIYETDSWPQSLHIIYPRLNFF